jgi:hypothetical protein
MNAMKKLLLASLLFTFFCLNNSSFAQLVTISATHQLPVIGDSIRYIDANTFGFDAAGTGPVTTKVWDFSLLMNAGTSVDFVWVDPATIPSSLGKDSFPTATIARRESSTPGYFYYQNTTNNINRIGAYVSATNHMIYKGGTVATEFHFPITAGNNFNSTYHGRYAPFNVGEDSVTVETGTLTINADMQGQMMLPTGTFTGVLRLHVVESFHLKTYMLGMAIMDNIISDDYYYWFVDSIFQPIMIYGITTVDGTAQTPILRYQPITVTKIDNAQMSDNINIFPNPSDGVFNVLLPQTNRSLNNITVTDVNGKVVFGEIANNQPISSINLSQQAPGVYFIKIEQDGKLTRKKVVLQ